MQIRDAHPDDVPAMAAIYDEQVRTSVATFDVVSDGGDALRAKVDAAGGSDHVLVAVEDGLLLGYAYSGPFRPRPAYAGSKEVTVYLAATARGRGVGRALYAVLLDRLDADPGVHTELAVVALPNEASERLHAAFGFTRVGVLREVGHKLGRWVDVAVLQRLTPPGSVAPVAEREQQLPGGNVSGAVRVGGTVRRRTGPWTPAVHALLQHLARAGVPAVPRVHGLDDRGREILDFLPGEVIDVDADVLTDARLAAVGRWLRTFHAATGDFPTTEHRWYFGVAARAPGQVICHHDVAPYNLAFDGDALAGVFDWELASPGHPHDDVAFLAWNGLPMLREVPGWGAADLARRADLLTRAYGDPALAPAALLHRALARMVTATDRIEQGQRSGDAGMLALATVGEPAATRARVAAARERLPAVLAALT